MCEYPMIALTLEITAIAFLVMAAAVAYLFRQAARAPKGYEDWDGFHLGEESQAHGKTQGRAHRRGRAVVPAIVSADDHAMPVRIHHGPPAHAAF
jgi:hypothetical protein